MDFFDTIIIGSGAGGLAAAVALAQAGQKVLVCEQHEVAGGWTHSFTLQGYRFNTGVHYIGELEVKTYSCEEAASRPDRLLRFRREVQ